jgi:outer membrane biosynthesis protein TonB
MQDRCLMAVVEQIAYPEEALEGRTSGTVTLTGRIEKDGGVAAIRVMNDLGASRGDDALVHAAAKNLGSWQFDRGMTDDAMQVTYSYDIDTSLPLGIKTHVEWKLPEGIMIRGNPK